MRHSISWGDFRFPGLNLWNAPPSPEMLSLYREMAEGMGPVTNPARRAEARRRLALAEGIEQRIDMPMLLAHH